jgi:hypothetical protein
MLAEKSALAKFLKGKTIENLCANLNSASIYELNLNLVPKPVVLIESLKHSALLIQVSSFKIFPIF